MLQGLWFRVGLTVIWRIAVLQPLADCTRVEFSTKNSVDSWAQNRVSC